MRVRELRASYHATDIDAPETTILTPEAAATLLRPFLEHEAQEVVMVIMLDTKSHVIAISTVSRGTLNASLVHPREVFKLALLANADSIILAHNHPSGDATPSQDDLSLTSAVAAAGNLLQVTLRDHVIIGRCATFWSARTAGRI